MLLLNKTVKTVQYPTCISFIENKNKKIKKGVKYYWEDPIYILSKTNT